VYACTVLATFIKNRKVLPEKPAVRDLFSYALTGFEL
jgi:hypothetical protein